MTVLRSPGSKTGRRTGWTTARIIYAAVGLLLAMCSLGLLGAGGVALWASTTQRHGGDIDLGTWSYRSTGYAVVSSTANLYGAIGRLPVPRSLLGTVRISVTPVPGSGPVFAGIASAGAASRYLAGVGYDTVGSVTHRHPVYTRHTGGAPSTVPGRADIWADRAAGPGTQTLTWPDRGGSWTVAAMNADGSHPVAVRITAAASLPSLPWIAAGLLVGGVLVLAAGLVLAAAVARRWRTRPGAGRLRGWEGGAW